MKPIVGPLAACGMVWLSCLCAGAQLVNPNTTEFITSSSPLPDGSVITTTYYSKLGGLPETRISSGPFPYPTAASPVTTAARPRIEQSVVTGGIVSAPSTGTPPTTSSALPTSPIIQFPATTSAAGSTFNNPSVNPAVIVPTWGNPFAGPRRYLPPNYSPATGNIGGQVTTGYLPTGTVYPYPVASTPPTLNGPTGIPPATISTANPAGVLPAYQLQNLPPGTYYGKGMIGQPRAYVDGQPVRNFFRFIFP